MPDSPQNNSSGSQHLGGFEILEKIGEGGMGTVYRARQKSLNRIVALKVLSQRLSTDEAYVHNFQREAGAAARLNHHNIVGVYEVGEADGLYFYAMEYIRGDTLFRWVQRQGALAEATVLEIGLCLASALKYAWGQEKLIHRDLKPENVMLDVEGNVKLCDLGLAKSFGVTSTMSLSGHVFGTPQYMSPEQARGERTLNCRSDIYSLGMTLYHVLTGQIPFQDGAPALIMARQLTEQLPDPRDIAPTASPHICRVLEKMLAKEASQRYQSWDEVIRDLQLVHAGQPPQCQPPPHGKSTLRRSLTAPSRPQAELRGHREELRKLRRSPTPKARAQAGIDGVPVGYTPTESVSTRKGIKSRVPILVAAAAGVALAVVVGWLFFRPPPPNHRPPPPVQVEAPVIDPPSDAYPRTVVVKLSCATQGATICYTTDGSDPDLTSILYSAQFSLTKTATIKARSFMNGMTDSSVSSATFVVQSPPQPPPPPGLTVDLGGGVKMDFVLINPGTFMMGSDRNPSEKPVHKVTITKPYYIGKFLVTQEQWKAVTGDNPSHFKGDRNPVEQVSWEDCQTFVRKLADKVPGQTFRLPTEAEWEYACRAGSTTDFCYGNDEGGLGAYAWYSNNANNTTHPVGEKKPNAWGLCDMHGNVWQLCADWYANYHGNVETDPTGASSGSARVLRGGSWDYGAAPCRSSSRAHFSPSDRGYGSGLRVVAVAQASQPGGPPDVPQPTAIVSAVEVGNLEEVKALIEDHPELVNAKNERGWTPLHFAAHHGHKDMAELLLDKGADPNAKTDVAWPDSGQTPLHFACAYPGRKDVVELLLAHNADVNAKDKDGSTPLHSAAGSDRKDLVELLLAHNADVTAKTHEGKTPLHVVASNGHKDVAELLLTKGADVNAKTINGETPLFLAAGSIRKDVVELIELLLAYKADVNAKCITGETPLHLAASLRRAREKHLAIAGSTPSDLADLANRKDVEEVLRKHGGTE